MNWTPKRVHLVDGFARYAGGVRAVCTCGEATTTRTSEDRALTALLADHGQTRPECALCCHDYSGLPWQQFRRRLTILHDKVEDTQFLACTDMPPSCRDGYAQRQMRLDRAAFEAFGIEPPPVQLRLIQGGGSGQVAR